MERIIKKLYSEVDIDYFVIYNIYSKLLLLLPINEFANRTAITVNIKPKETRN